MSAIPPWKKALLQRKKKQEEAEKSKLDEAERERLASLPAWKRAIITREKPTSISDASKPVHTAGKLSKKWQVAVERIKGPDSPILNQKPWARTSPQNSSNSGEEAFGGSPRSTITKQVVHLWNHVTSANETSSYKKASTNTPSASSNTPSASSNTPSASSNTPSASSNTPSASSNTPSASSHTPSSTLSRQDEDDLSLVNLPPWKKALILKKRRTSQQQQRTVVSSATLEVKERGTDEIDSGVITSSPSSRSTSLPAKSSSIQPQSRPPTVVNRMENEAGTNHRLIEQEGITLHPPVYREVDQWANVNEEDKKFKDLPLWKQALIKRRRADITNRSRSSPTTLPSNGAVGNGATSQPEKSTPAEKPQLQSTHYSKATDSIGYTNQSKKVFTSKTITNHNIKNNAITSRSHEVRDSSKVTTTESRISAKPLRKAPLPPEKKVEPMFCYNFSHRTLDTGNTSSDSTDSDLEDAIITNLDDSSDEGDSGIVLQSYTSSKSSSDSTSTDMGQENSGQSAISVNQQQPVISNPEKKKKRHLRRVSWSDTQLVSEHFYPKYDYSDYDDIDQVTKSSSNENGSLSHRLHPSLRSINDTNPDPYNYGYSSPPTSPKNSSTESPFTNFGPSSPRILAGYDDLSVDEPPSNSAAELSPTRSASLQLVDTNDIYTDLFSNTAALLW